MKDTNRTCQKCKYFKESVQQNVNCKFIEKENTMYENSENIENAQSSQTCTKCKNTKKIEYTLEKVKTNEKPFLKTFTSTIIVDVIMFITSVLLFFALYQNRPVDLFDYIENKKNSIYRIIVEYEQFINISSTLLIIIAFTIVFFIILIVTRILTPFNKETKTRALCKNC